MRFRQSSLAGGGGRGGDAGEPHRLKHARHGNGDSHRLRATRHAALTLTPAPVRGSLTSWLRDRCRDDVYILAFAERILPRASDLWVIVAESKAGLQQLFFPDGIAFDGKQFNRTAATAPLFKYLAPSGSTDERVVTLTFASWNPLRSWLRQLDSLRGTDP